MGKIMEIEFDSLGDKGLSKIEIFQSSDRTVLNSGKFGIELSHDQWGNWISLNVGDSRIFLQQEFQTRSFFKALIIGLEKLVETELTLPPTVKEYE